MERRTGETTRLIDFFIQELFTKGEVEVYDHHPSRDADINTFIRVLSRLKYEHNYDTRCIEIDRKNLTIKLINNKGYDRKNN